MGDKESVQNYLSKVTNIVSQMRCYGEKISNEDVVSKVLWSLNKNRDNFVLAIKEAQDMSSYTVDEIMGSL